MSAMIDVLSVPDVDISTLTNATYSFYPGWVPTSDEWNAMFGGKTDALNGTLTSPSVLGNMTLYQEPTADQHAATKRYVDAVLGSGNSLPDAPADGTPYCRLNNSWSPAPTSLPTQNVGGDMTISGALSVGGTATLATGPLLLGTTANAGFMLDTWGSARFLTLTSNPAGIFDSGSGASLAALLPTGTTLAVAGSDGAIVRSVMMSFGAANPALDGYSIGGTRAAPSATGTGRKLHALRGSGRGATGTALGGEINFTTTEDWTDTAQGCQFNFVGNSTGSNVNTVWMRLRDGNALLGTLTAAGYRLDVNGSTGVRINANAGEGQTPAMNTLLAIIGPDNGAPRLMMDCYGTGFAPQFTFRRAEGSGGSPGALANARLMGVLNYQGHDGSAYSGSQAFMNVSSGGAWTPTSHPTYIGFGTTAVGSAAAAIEAMRIQPSGNVSIGPPAQLAIDNGYRLDVRGGGRFDTYTSTGTLPTVGGTTSLWLGAVDNTQPILSLAGIGTGAQGVISFYRAAGTRAVPTAVPLNAAVGTIQAIGYGSTGWSTTARANIGFIATELWTDTAQGTAIRFLTTPNTTVAVAEVARIWGSGNVSIGNTVDSGIRLDVTGSARFGTVGFNGTAPLARPTINGACAGNTAIKALLTSLASYGLLTDATSA